MSVSDVNQLMKKFNETKKMMKKMMPAVEEMQGGKKGKDVYKRQHGHHQPGRRRGVRAAQDALRLPGDRKSVVYMVAGPIFTAPSVDSSTPCMIR